MRARKVVALAVAVCLALAPTAASMPSAQAVVVKPFTLGYDKTVYGDFIEVGNGNLRCPTAADSVPVLSGSPVADCAAGQAGTKSTQNNTFYMLQSDVDSDPSTFNSGQARVTVPPGARVDFARLNWGGDTGVFKKSDGTQSAVASCTATGQNAGNASTVPPGSPTTQKPRLTVGQAAARDVSPAAVNVDPFSAVGNNAEQFYTGYADVTAAFNDVPTGSPVTLTVGNVWSPQGFNCFAGWSIVLVYSYLQRTPPYAPGLREVFVYDGHVRQGAADPVTTTTVTGFRAAANRSRVGITAYEGDRGINGDQFLINGTAQNEPGGLGSTSNFFVSKSDGASNPSPATNFSTDAKALETTQIPVGATSANVSFSTSGDGYVAQNLVLSIPVPELLITKTADPTTAHAGDQVTFTISVSNPGSTDADASNVIVRDPLFPSCNRTLGTLPGGGPATTYTCVGTLPADDVTNVAAVTGTSALGDQLTGAAAANVDIIHPAISITKTADHSGYRTGDTATFTITVTNTGDTTLSGTAVSDPHSASCNRTVGTLAAGASTTYQCTARIPISGGVNVAGVSGTDQLGRTVSDTASVAAPVIVPSISITKSASPTIVRAGEAVTYTLVVTNTGDSTLADVTVTDPRTPSCARSLGTLAAGEVRTYTCSATPSATVDNVAGVSGTDLSGKAVGDSDDAAVTVIRPAISLTKTATGGPYRAGDPITYTLTVVNTGDVPLTDVAVADPSTPVCARTIDALAVGESVAYTCATTAGTDDVTNDASVFGTDPAGRPVSDTAQAVVSVIHPAIDIAKSVTPAVVRVGDIVTYTIVVTNSGDVELTNVTVADPSTPSCARTIGTLAAGATRSVTCTASATSDDFTNTATVTGMPPTGPAVTDSDSVAVDVIHPAVEIAKTATPATARPGEVVTFSIVVRNSGDVDLTAVVVSDAAYPACDRTIGTLAVSGVRSYTCTATAPSADIANTASVTGTAPVGPVVSDAATATVDVVHPGLEITKSVAPTVAHPGDPVTYRITVRNTGDVTLSDVGVSDPLVPACDRTVGDLEVGGLQTYTCAGVAPFDDQTNTALAFGTPPDGSPVRASATASLDVIHPALVVTKEAAPQQVRAGDTVLFTITVTNAGDVPLDPVTITDPEAADCARTLGAPLAVGESTVVRCQAVAGTDDVVNTVTVTGTDPTGRDITTTAQAAVDVVHPALAVTKTVAPLDAQPGQPVTYTVVVLNSGDVPLTDVVVNDPLVPACSTTIALLGPAETHTITCSTTAPASSVANTATATGRPPTGPDVSAEGSAQLTVDHPSLAVGKTVNVTRARPGDPVLYTITVTNTGDVALAPVTVTDPAFPSCGRTLTRLEVGGTTTYDCTVAAPLDDVDNVAVADGATPSGPDVQGAGDVELDVIHPGVEIGKTASPTVVRAGDTVTYTITVANTGDVPLSAVQVTDPTTPACARTVAALPVDDSLTYTCAGIAGADDYVNTALVTADDPLGGPLEASADAAVDVVHPSVTIGKSVLPDVARVGDPVVYTITVTNSGDVPLDAVSVADAVAPACARVLGTLTGGQSVTYTCAGTAPDDDVTNTATVTGTPPVGPDVSATDDATLDVVHPAVSITKTGPSTPVDVGDIVTFTITVTNTGDTELAAVTVTDEVAPDCARVLGTLAIGAAATFTCTMPAAANDYANTAVVVGQPPLGATVSATADAPVTVLHPGVTIVKTGPTVAVAAGSDVTFTITVTNTGDAALTDTQVTDPIAPDCARTIGALAVGQVVTYSCVVVAPQADFTNVATVVGTDPTGGTAFSRDDAPVRVVHPSVSITKTVLQATVAPGSPVTFRITVRNTGDVDLVDLAVTDPLTTTCARTIGRLDVGAATTWTCTATATRSFTNVASVAATPVECRAAPTTCLTPVSSGPVRSTDGARVNVNDGGRGTEGTGTHNGTGPVAVTGTDLSDPLGWAGGLLVLGALLLLAGRRRRPNSGAT